jgi:glycosyltransferase involved in cell wall biosynthesis
MTKSVAMAKFGRDQCKEYYNLDTEYIPHAVDTNIFYRLSEEERNKARTKYGFQDKFVVGVVARNQGRKMLDRTIKAFKLFCKDKPDAVLFMHTDPYDRAGQFDIQALIQREGIMNRVIFSGMNFFKGFDYKQMNEIYNVMDVFLLTTSGEGFGVPIIEAMACQVPVFATDYTTTPELVKEHFSGMGINLAAEITGSWNVERGVMDDIDCANKLTVVYKDRNLLKVMGENGKKAVDQYYSWDVVIEQWDKFFTELKDAI